MRRFDLTEAEMALVREAGERGWSLREAARVVLRSPRILPEAVRLGLRAALAGARNSSELVWILDSERTRQLVPDAARGAGWGKQNELAFVDALVPRLEASARALELGCGGGRISRHVAPRVSSLLCTDVSDTMLREARENLAAFANVEFARVRPYALDGIPDASFDIVFGQGILGYIEPNRAFALLDEAGRVTRPGGLCAFNFFTVDRPDWAAAHLEMVRRSRASGAGQPRPYTADLIDAMYRAVGLEPVEHRHWRQADGPHETSPYCVAIGRASQRG